MPKAKVIVDKEKCIGCGACEATCPQAFKLVDGKAKFIGKGAESCIQPAIDSCPVQAITK
jgi:ferredoxin